MVLLCFVLDLRSLSPPVFRNLKQSLFQLANYYAVSRPRIGSKHQVDRIGICYVVRNRATCCSELKIAYNPQGNFNLRELHHALNTLPSDGCAPDDNNCCDLYIKLADLLSQKVAYSWASSDSNDTKKVILITSLYFVTLDSVMMKALVDASENIVTVEFILLDQNSSFNGGVMETMDHFEQQLASLKNCSFQKCISVLQSKKKRKMHGQEKLLGLGFFVYGIQNLSEILSVPQALHGLIKRWSLELQDESEDPLEARFVFKTNLLGPVNSICCNLRGSFSSIDDEFVYSKTSRYNSNKKQSTCSSSTPITDEQQGAFDTTENSVRVGAFTVLHMPSFQDNPEPKPVSCPIEFNVIQRTDLGSLSEGLITGASYYVSPSSGKGSENGKSELNTQIFQVVCRFLNSVDDGLVCYTNCNIETLTETSFRFYYVLLPSHQEQMLLRRLSASEEFLPSPGVTDSIVSEEIETAVQSALKKVEVGDYNPLQHERGFHQKLNFLVKESLHLSAVPPKISTGSVPQSSELTQTTLVPESNHGDSVTSHVKTIPQVDTESPPPSSSESAQNTLKPSTCDSLATSPCTIEEWEQLLVSDLEGITASPKCTSLAKLDHLGSSSPSRSIKELDQKTSRILERLEVPNRLKRKAAVSPVHVSTPVKKPLMLPYKSAVAADTNHAPDSSQPLKPIFQRMRKKRW